jgi:hypothetical protein
LIFRAVVAAGEKEEFAKYLHKGKLGKLGVVRYVLAKDLAFVANQIADNENYTDPTKKKKDDEITS